MIRKIEYTLTKSRIRKNIKVQISREGAVSVSAPSFLKKKEVEQYLKSQEEWVEQQLALIAERKKEEADFRAENGFYYLGDGYDKVYVMVSDKERVELGQEATIYLKKRENEGLVLEKFYRQKGSEWIEKLTEKWFPKFEIKPISIKMRRQQSVWGTCTPAGRINLNIQLMKGPLEVFEYVFVHEMCHLIQANHSPLFWKTVESYMPDYKEKRNWLRDNGHLLFL